jgi:hypothetical protein
MRYQTEIHVSTDRYVCLQLPSFFPEGRATVTVTVESGGPSADEGPAGDDSDRQDIEWWDEFDDEVGRGNVKN